MKKILLTLAAGVLAMAASAQVWVGGGVGLGFDAVVNGGSRVDFRLAPEVGYQIDNKWAVALETGVDINHMGGVTDTFFDLGPYVRYNFVKLGKFDLFGEFALHYVHHDVSGAGEDGMNMVIRPGVGFNINKNWAITGKLDLLKYEYLNGGDTSDIGLRLSTGLTLGVVYNF